MTVLKHSDTSTTQKSGLGAPDVKMKTAAKCFKIDTDKTVLQLRFIENKGHLKVFGTRNKHEDDKTAAVRIL